nr:hypothetical protein [Tessaracoccus coleopterorum]
MRQVGGLPEGLEIAGAQRLDGAGMATSDSVTKAVRRRVRSSSWAATARSPSRASSSEASASATVASSLPVASFHNSASRAAFSEREL